jgi:hypothetical protein
MADRKGAVINNVDLHLELGNCLGWESLFVSSSLSSQKQGK